MSQINHRFIETNGIRLHLAECGRGPLVVLCHGFPECWYSWRYQLPALAEAGFHAVAPDLRGYGRSSRPKEAAAYDLLQITGDLVGLVAALGAEQAGVIGHDWGAHAATHAALLRPDLFRAVALLSVPYRVPSAGPPPTTVWRKMLRGDQRFYVLDFQKPGPAEAELSADVRATLLKFLYGASGSAPPEDRLRMIYRPPETFLETASLPAKLPSWLSEDDLAYYIAEFERTGFRGALNWYRNVDRNRHLTPFLHGAKLSQPVLFVGGEEDAVTAMTRDAYAELEKAAPELRMKILFPEAGHWIQQECAAEVNELLVGFLRRTNLAREQHGPARGASYYYRQQR